MKILLIITCTAAFVCSLGFAALAFPEISWRLYIIAAYWPAHADVIAMGENIGGGIVHILSTRGTPWLGAALLCAFGGGAVSLICGSIIALKRRAAGSRAA